MNGIAKIMFVLLIAVMLVGVTGCAPKFNQEEVDTMVADAEAAKDAEHTGKLAEIKEVTDAQLDAEKAKLVEAKTALADGLATTEELQTNYDALKSVSEEQETAIAELQIVQEEEEIVEAGYSKDEMSLGSTYEIVLTDRKLDKLFDGEVDFDGEDYDAEETFTLKDVQVAINEEDFKSDAYLSFPENGIEYVFTFADDLNTTLIGVDDETLKFDLLGESVEVSKWELVGSDYKVTFTKGQEYFVTEGEIVTVGETNFEFKFIGNDDIFVKVGDDNVKIEETFTDDIAGFEIYVESVIDDDEGPDYAMVKIGKEVTTTIVDGKEYADDSIWNWVIDANSIGIVLNTEFESIDEDEDYQALAYGGDLCLPNNYACVKFDGLTEEDTEKYTLEYKTKDASNYIKVKGTLLFGINDYDIVYVDADGFYDEDLVEIVNETGTLDLDDTAVTMKIVNDTLVMDDIILALDMTTLDVGADDLVDVEDDYRTSYGIVVKTPEDSMEDKDLTIIVPEEKLEASLSVY